MALLRAGGITGWRRGQRLALRGQWPVAGGQSPVIGDQLPMPGGHANGRGLEHPATTDRSCGQGPDTGHRSLATGTVKPDFVFRKARLVGACDR